MTKLRENKSSIIPAALFVLLAAVLLWRCRYGYAVRDEVFYIATPYRLMMGDGLITQEWNQSQLSALLILPLLKLYSFLNPDMDGLVLSFRLICTCMLCLGALFVYYRLKKFNKPGAYAGALCFMLYVPFGIPALSYNSMSIMGLVLALVIMLTAEKRRKLQFFVAGFIYAGAVLCCPYLVLGWLIQAAAVLIRGAWKNKKAWEEFLCFTLAAVIAAACFFAYLLSRASLEGLIQALPNILNDPEHPPVSLLQRAKDLITGILYASPRSLIIYAFLALLFAGCAVDKKRREHAGIYLPAAAVLCALLLLELMIFRDHINLLVWPVNILGLMAFMLSEDKASGRVFLSLWLPGMFYALCIHFASNLAFTAFSSASSAALPGSMLMLAMTVKQRQKEGKGRRIKYAALAFVLFFLCSLTYFRVDKVYLDENLSQQSRFIDEGIQKGILSSPEHTQNYYLLLEDIAEINSMGLEKMVFLSPETGACIQGGFENCAYSSWISGINEHTMDRLRAYWELNRDKLPQGVYTEKENLELVLPLSQELGLEAKEMKYGYIFS